MGNFDLFFYARPGEQPDSTANARPGEDVTLAAVAIGPVVDAVLVAGEAEASGVRYVTDAGRDRLVAPGARAAEVCVPGMGV